MAFERGNPLLATIVAWIAMLAVAQIGAQAQRHLVVRWERSQRHFRIPDVRWPATRRCLLSGLKRLQSTRNRRIGGREEGSDLAAEQQELGAEKEDGNVEQDGVEQEAERGKFRGRDEHHQRQCGNDAEENSPPKALLGGRG